MDQTSQTPPPAPPPPTIAPPPAPASPPPDLVGSYQKAADRLGFVPSFRLGDNLLSAAGGGVGIFLGAATGGILGSMAERSADSPPPVVIGLAVGAVLGGIVGVFMVGIYLGIRNFFR